MAGIYLNEDNSHYFMSRAEKASDPSEIQGFIKQYSGTGVERLILCANAQKTNFPTKAGTIIYKDVPEDENFKRERPVFMKWSNAVRDIVEKGVDIYSLWIETAREEGISPWMSMRMNDVHNADNPEDPIHGDFFKKHPGYRIAPYRDRDWHDSQLDYLREEVRDYHFALVGEYFEKYDFDGLELDWMRFANHFPPGYEDEGRKYLDGFMKDVRGLADAYEKKRGHAIGVGARVPIEPETAFDMGMDGVGWALAGYVDYLAPSPFWHTSQADVPVERWKRQVKDTGCKITPCLEICLRQCHHPKCRMESPFNSLETLKAAARSFLDRGADAVYLFNYMDGQGFAYDEDGYREIINTLGDYGKISLGLRRHVLTFTDRRPEGAASNERLPDALEKGGFHGYRIHTGKMQDGEKGIAVLSFLSDCENPGENVEVFVNGRKCAFKGSHESAPPAPVDPLYAWDIPAEARKDGYQLVEVRPKREGIVLDWVEIALGSV